VLILCQFLENRHRDVICTHCALNKILNSQWIGVCQHMQHGTVILKDYLLHVQWNKPIWILVYEVTASMDMILNGEMWRKANHKMIGIIMSEVWTINESFIDQRN